MNPVSLLKDTLEVIQIVESTPPMIALLIGIIFGGASVVMLLRYFNRRSEREKQKRKDTKVEVFANKPVVVVDKNPRFFYEGYFYLFIVIKPSLEIVGKAKKDGMSFLLYRLPGTEKPIVILPEKGAPEGYAHGEIALLVKVIREYYRFVAGPEGLNIAFDHGYKKVAEIFFDEVRWF